MVPMFDMFNHSPLANVVHAFDPRAQAVRVTSRQAWAAGGQVFLNYGDIPAMRSFWLHGFVTPQPEYEAYTLELMLPPTGGAFAARAALITAHAGLVQPPQLVGVFLNAVPVAAPLLQFHKGTKAGSADQQAIELFANPALHKLCLLPFHKFAFGIGGTAFIGGAISGDGFDFPFVGVSGVVQRGGQQAVDDEVGIAADGRGEVGVMLKCQAEVV